MGGHQNIEPHVKPSRAFQEEISYHMGILFKGNRKIVPSTLPSEILKLIHQGHFGMDKSKQRSRSSLYWPWLDNEIEHLVSNCSTCSDHRNKHRRVSMIPHDIPDVPSVKVATLNNRDYIIPVDYHSEFIEVPWQNNTKSRDVIKAIKHVFSIHEIPKEVLSNNGRRYVSKEFKTFSTAWDFEHDSTRPEFPQSNGLVEREIQTVKRTPRKAEESNEDPYLGLLNLIKMVYHRTLLPSMKESCQKILCQPKSIKPSNKRYDQGAVELKPLEPCTTVRI